MSKLMLRLLTPALLLGATTPDAGDRCRAAIAYSEARGGATLVVYDHGRLVCETPAGGGMPLELASATKSVVGLAAAAAVQDGLLTLDERVSDTLTDWRADPLKRDATIRQLLSMTAGLPSRIGKPPSYIEAAALPFNAAPGTAFQYGPAPIQVFGALLTAKLRAKQLDGSPRAYIDRRIFKPIGLRYMQWRVGPDGQALLPQGLVLSGGDLARLGLLVLAHGVARGAPIVDRAAFDQLFQGSRANPSYGLTWWLAKGPPSEDPITRTWDLPDHPGAVPADTVAAAGAGDQRLYVIPSRGLVIARQARLRYVRVETGEARWSDTAFLRTLL